MIDSIRSRIVQHAHTGDQARPHLVVTRLLHWLVGGLLIYGLVFPADAAALANPLALQLEAGFALLLTVLFLIRLVWFSTADGGSRLPADAPRWEHVLSRTVHFGIYSGIFAMTATGVALAMTAQASIAAFGFSAVGMPSIPNQNVFLVIHEGLAGALITLILLHVAGALWHWVVRKDGVWQSMLWSAGRGSDPAMRL